MLSSNTMVQDTETELRRLEKRIDTLLALCEKLQSENKSLRFKQEELGRDRTHLLKKTTLAKTRIEAMINRLKSLGQGT